MKTANGINLTMLCDFYELTMGNGYWKAQDGSDGRFGRSVFHGLSAGILVQWIDELWGRFLCKKMT